MFKIADLFTCPSCGSHRLEEVLTDVVESSEVTDLAVEELRELFKSSLPTGETHGEN